MKKINIIGTIIILCMIVVVSCKKYEDKSLQRGVGDVPTISDVNPAIFDKYIGKYDIGNNAVIEVSKDGDHLMFQGPNMPKYQLLPQGIQHRHF